MCVLRTPSRCNRKVFQMTSKWSLAGIPKTEKKLYQTIISVFGRALVREPSQRMPGKGFSDNCTSKKVSTRGPNARNDLPGTSCRAIVASGGHRFGIAIRHQTTCLASMEVWNFIGLPCRRFSDDCSSNTMSPRRPNWSNSCSSCYG